MHTAIIKALEERQRQINEEGFSLDHDDEYIDGDLAAAGASYAAICEDIVRGGKSALDWQSPAFWPWPEKWWKPSEDPQRNIIKAMALLSAEYDRLERAKAAALPAQDPTPVECWAESDSVPFRYKSLSELLKSIDGLKAGDTVFVGSRETIHASALAANMHEAVLEQLLAAAEGEVGEAAEDYPDTDKQENELLDTFVKSWAELYCQPNFYLVENAKPYDLTAADIELANQERN